ncbi:hypothetical protein GCM10022206_25560 [Streptomyces chiangmaiensis]
MDTNRQSGMGEDDLNHCMRPVTCEVSDTDAFVPRPRRTRSTDENGRGLFLVGKLPRRWGSRATPGGKVVWAEQDLPHISGPRSART